MPARDTTIAAPGSIDPRRQPPTFGRACARGIVALVGLLGAAALVAAGAPEASAEAADSTDTTATTETAQVQVAPTLQP